MCRTSRCLRPIFGRGALDFSEARIILLRWCTHLHVRTLGRTHMKQHPPTDRSKHRQIYACRGIQSKESDFRCPPEPFSPLPARPFLLRISLSCTIPRRSSRATFCASSSTSNKGQGRALICSEKRAFARRRELPWSLLGVERERFAGRVVL